MDKRPEDRINADGEPVAVLLDQDEYLSNIGNVVAISNRQISLLRRDRHELTHFRLEYIDIRNCRAIEYRKEVAYSRILAGVVCSIAAFTVVFMLLTDLDDFSAESAPLIIAVIGLVSFGIRFITSTHRHVIHFEMPDETLIWRSPATDFASRADAAHAVREYARKRGIYRQDVS